MDIIYTSHFVPGHTCHQLHAFKVLLIVVLNVNLFCWGQGIIVVLSNSVP